MTTVHIVEMPRGGRRLRRTLTRVTNGVAVVQFEREVRYRLEDGRQLGADGEPTRFDAWRLSEDDCARLRAVGEWDGREPLEAA